MDDDDDSDLEFNPKEKKSLWGLARVVITYSKDSYRSEVLLAEGLPNRNIAAVASYKEFNPEPISEIAEAHTDDLLCAVECLDDGVTYEIVGSLYMEYTESWTDCGTEYDAYASFGPDAQVSIVPECIVESLTEYDEKTAEEKDFNAAMRELEAK